jgi:four helix bundle protein
MTGGSQTRYDFEERSITFAKEVRRFLKNVPRTVANHEDGRQLIRASGSVGANYIEANDSLGDKDFLLRLKIARKEARETRYWLQLLDVQEQKALEENREKLVQETTELIKILSAMIRNRQGRVENRSLE